MLSLQESSKILKVLEEGILCWVNCYTGFQQIKEMVELGDGEFFLQILNIIPNFKLLQPILVSQKDQSLAAKVSIIKNINQSLIQYHQVTLLHHLHNPSINCVELAMGNKKQIFKLVTLIISAIICTTAKQDFLPIIMNMPQQNMEVFQILIENSLRLVQIGNSSSRSSPQSDRAKILRRMEYLQDKVDELESANIKLVDLVEEERQNYQTLMLQKERREDDLSKIAEKNLELQENIERYSKDLKLWEIQKNTEKRKLQGVKNKYEEKIEALYKKVENLQKNRQEKDALKKKIQSLENINKEIKEENDLLRDEIEKLEKQVSQTKKREKEMIEKFLCLQKNCGDLEVRIEQLSICNKMGNNSFISGEFGEEQGCESNRYRIKENIGWIKNDSIKINNSRLGSMSEIKQILESQDELVKSQFFQKENSLNFMNKQKSERSEKGKENENEKNYQVEEEIKFLLSVIFDQQEHIENQKRMDKSSSFEDLRNSRKADFLKKVKGMFH